MDQGKERQELLALTTEIVSAHAGRDAVAASDLPAFISGVFQSLRAAGQEERQEPVAAPVSAVPVKRSVTPDFLVCLEDGRKVRTPKRYLANRYGLTPEQYRKRWGLAPDYPMVAPSYAARRSALAKQIGLGRKPATTAETPPPAPEPIPTPAPAEAKAPPRRRAAGRRKAA